MNEPHPMFNGAPRTLALLERHFAEEEGKKHNPVTAVRHGEELRDLAIALERELAEATSRISEGGNAAMEAMCKVSCALRKAVDRLPEGDPAITGLSIARTLLDTEIEGLYATGAVPTPSTHAAKEAP
jgi:hypothetical protein